MMIETIVVGSKIVFWISIVGLYVSSMLYLLHVKKDGDFDLYFKRMPERESKVRFYFTLLMPVINLIAMIHIAVRSRHKDNMTIYEKIKTAKKDELILLMSSLFYMVDKETEEILDSVASEYYISLDKIDENGTINTINFSKDNILSLQDIIEDVKKELNVEDIKKVSPTVYKGKIEEEENTFVFKLQRRDKNAKHNNINTSNKAES